MATDPPTLHLLCGKIAAGKSTLARRLGAQPNTIVVSEDHWLARLYPGEQNSLSDYLRNSTRLRDAMATHLVALLRTGISVILDFPANTPTSRAWMRTLFEQAGVAHQLHHLDLDDATCKARLRQRNAEGAHAFTVSDADYELFTSHFVPPASDEGFNVVLHPRGMSTVDFSEQIGNISASREIAMTAKFDAFAALHVPGSPVILFNVWDAGSARVAEKAGAKAIATGSASVATAHGFSDAESLPLDLALANAERIVCATALPVSVDFEGGYSVDPEETAANVARLAATGAIGCNFEDQIIATSATPGRTMHDVADQSARIAAIVRAAPDFFVNARTDIFLIAKADSHDDAMADAAIARGKAYADAGAHGFFVPGLADLRLLERVCKAVPLPVNFMAFPGAPSAQDVAATGIARISHGPFPHLLAMKAFEDAARAAFDG